MFDYPKKELEELEDQLLAAEENPENTMLDEQEFEALYNEILVEFGHQNDEPTVRNFANGYGKNAPQPEQYEQVCEPVTPQEAPPQKKRKGNRGLVLTIIAEVVAIGAVVAFWALSMRE